MPDFDRFRESLRKHSGKIVSGIGAVLITPLVARVVSDASGWIVDKVWRTDEAVKKSGGSPSEDYTEWTKKELYRLAQELEIHGRSKMRKAELIEAIRAHERQQSDS
jgi:aspartate/tyrosine/aromatic aminotransferase